MLSKDYRTCCPRLLFDAVNANRTPLPSKFPVFCFQHVLLSDFALLYRKLPQLASRALPLTLVMNVEHITGPLMPRQISIWRHRIGSVLRTGLDSHVSPLCLSVSESAAHLSSFNRSSYFQLNGSRRSQKSPSSIPATKLIAIT
jgi:hypothetical protein